jgi:hypothetical protein
MAGLPIKIILFGSNTLTYFLTHCLQQSRWYSLGAKLRPFFIDLQLTEFIIKKSSLYTFISSNISQNILPVLPTNGSFCSISFWPGASTTIIHFDFSVQYGFALPF